MVKKVNLVVDMYGCPNRCLHCWLGHMPNKTMEDGSDDFIADYFSPYFEQVAYYSWLREPDYCDDYEGRWRKDCVLSKNCVPERFELASFYRIVRDEKYIPFLKSLGVKKVQLTFFGLKETQDRYVGRRGAFEEVLEAGNRLIKGGIIPRFQCFLNEENIMEICQIREMAEAIRGKDCPQLEFFVHEGSCDGENRKLYPIRIEKSHIPDMLKDVYLNYDSILSESDCHRQLIEDHSCPCFAIGDEITLNISNRFDVYYNFTAMSKEWKIANLKKEEAGSLVQRIISGDTLALNEAKKCTWAFLAGKYGDPLSDKVFSLEDYKIYLFNEHLKERFKNEI